MNQNDTALGYITPAEKRKLRVAQAQRISEARTQVRAAVARGTCPYCGAKLRRNLSLTGWWQCEQLGAPGFRKDDAKESCDWQGFTE